MPCRQLQKLRRIFYVTRSSSVLIALVLLCLGLCGNTFAQTSKGFVTGNITDPNGAAITGATIKITNNTTGVSRETISTNDGNFRIDAIEPGLYNIVVVHS